MRHQRSRLATAAARLLLLAASTGCAATGASPEDPYEGFNRGVFAFNEGVDEYVVGPVAWVWDAIFPLPVQAAFVRVFANLDTPLNVVQHALTAEWADSGSELSRFVINSTVGLAGLFDPASHWGLPPRPTDFGATLATWGLPAGPYLVLPFFGPNTARSTVGLAGDIPLGIELYHAYGLRVTPTRAVELVNARSFYDLDLGIARDVALDYYLYVRSAYLQRRGVLQVDYGDVLSEPYPESEEDGDD